MEPLKQTQVEGHTMFVEPDVLFGNLDELCCVLYAFCKEYIKFVLHDLQSRGDVRITSVLVKLFEKSALATSLLQAFYKYTLNYSSARNYLDELRKNSEFTELEKWCQRDPRCKKLQLTDLLVAPVQHTMKILIILKDLEMCSTSDAEKKIIGDIVAAQEGWLRVGSSTKQASFPGGKFKPTLRHLRSSVKSWQHIPPDNCSLLQVMCI